MNATNRQTASILLLGAHAMLPLSGMGAGEGDDWRWTLTPYAWATDVGVDVELAGREVVDEIIPVEDLMEDLDVTFQGRVEAQRGAHGVMLDLFYVSMSDEVDGLGLPQGAGQADLDWRVDLTIADVAGIYDPHGDGQGFSFLYGARVIDQRAEVDAHFTTTSGAAQEQYEANETLIDALAGVRFHGELTRHLSFQSQLDASTGGTELTWSAFPALSYGFGSGCAALVAGYRYMAIDFEDEGGLEAEMTLSGPVLGFRFSL